MNTNDAIKILKDNGLKYTKKREDMINIFVKEDKYINAKHIQQQLDKDYPGISFDTIYRNLHLFKDLKNPEEIFKLLSQLNAYDNRTTKKSTLVKKYPSYPNTE